MIISLPWPDKGLSPNARLHWAPKAKIKATARRDAMLLAYDAMHDANVPQRAYEGKGKIPYKVTFYPPDKRRRDDDNMIGSFKAARDGIADAMGVDDRRFQAHYFFGDPLPGGQVIVEIGDAL